MAIVWRSYRWLFEHHLFLPEGLGFYYLDAHWNESLPLREEVH